jgi:beta-glucanase (GH16 family)
MRFKAASNLLACLYLLLQPLLASATYTLVWSDEFDYTGLPDPVNWNYDVGGWGWGNNELQYYREADLDNTRVESGNLIIELREETVGSNNYTSGRLLTKGKWDWTYGRFEARIKVPDGAAGMWPAFWMLGSDIDAVGWPQCGEIDILEYVSRVPDEIFGTIHGPGYSGGAAFGNIFDFGGPVSNEYHVYAVEWKPNEIRWYVDENLYHIAVPDDVAPNPWVFDHSHFIILNLALGGHFGGALSPSLTFPQQMLVDYVRVYADDSITVPVLPLPGLVEAEDFSNKYGIIFEQTSDTGGGRNAGYMTDGDWLEYQVETTTAGLYSVDLRGASPAGLAKVVVSSGDESFTSSFIPATGGWQNWSTVRVGEIALPLGQSILRLTIDSPIQEDLNVNWMDIGLVEAYETEPDLGIFKDYVAEDGWIDTGNYLGWVYMEYFPWVYSDALGKYLFHDGSGSNTGWFFIPSM